MKNLGLILIAVLTMTSVVFAQKANVNAPQGGSFVYNMGAEPESLHPIMAGDLYETWVARYVHDYLCTTDFNTWEMVPRLAEKWEVSKDGLSFTFFLRKDAFFQNGDPVTAEDVKFSLDAIRNPKHQALNLVPYFEDFTKVDVIDAHTIKFVSKTKYFQSLNTLCTNLTILPKSVYGDIAKSVKMQKEVIGAGPYKLEKYDKGQSITLKKMDNWYGKNVPALKGYFNFDKIIFKFTKDDNVLIEKLKKADIDYTELGSEAYLKASGKPFKPKAKLEKSSVIAVKNEMPKSYGYIGFNFKDSILADRSVRLAFAHLVHRAEMNKKFAENLNDLANGPVPVNSKQAADMKPIEFSPTKAKELLTKAGWADSDKNGILDKVINGQKTDLRLSMIYANKDSEKYWTIVKEDCKKAGLELELKLLEWNTFVKTIDERKMQLWAMGWGGGDVEMDPKQIWHSSSSTKGGSNYGSYANAEVDKLIDEGRQELDAAKRTKIFKKAYTLIAEDVPYVFMFNRKYEFYGMSHKVKSPTDTFKYDFGYRTWWSAQK